MFDIKGWAKEAVKEWLTGVLKGVAEFLVDFSYAVALVGSGICILLWAGGWTNGRRWAGVLVMIYVLFRYLLG